MGIDVSVDQAGCRMQGHDEMPMQDVGLPEHPTFGMLRPT
jgi:hypothetical protein